MASILAWAEAGWTPACGVGCGEICVSLPSRASSGNESPSLEQVGPCEKYLGQDFFILVSRGQALGIGPGSVGFDQIVHGQLRGPHVVVTKWIWGCKRDGPSAASNRTWEITCHVSGRTLVTNPEIIYELTSCLWREAPGIDESNAGVQGIRACVG